MKLDLSFFFFSFSNKRQKPRSLLGFKTLNDCTEKFLKFSSSLARWEKQRRRHFISHKAHTHTHIRMRNTRTATIQSIDPSSVHRICSGQVILDISSCAKELIENSADAGATSVEIRMREFGLESVEVSDNGSGVAREDVKMLTMKYATSKLRTFQDLSLIHI